MQGFIDALNNCSYGKKIHPSIYIFYIFFTTVFTFFNTVDATRRGFPSFLSSTHTQSLIKMAKTKGHIHQASDRQSVRQVVKGIL